MEIFAKVTSAFSVLLSIIFGKKIELIINYGIHVRLRKILNTKEIEFLID